MSLTHGKMEHSTSLWKTGSRYYHWLGLGLLAIAIGLAFVLSPINAHADMLYVSSSGNNKIEKYDLATGADLGAFVNTGFSPYGLAFDSVGNLFVAKAQYSGIEKFSSTGTDLGSFVGYMDLPSGMAFDSAGNLYVGEYGPGRITKFTPGGVSSFFSAANWHVSGLAFDSAGNLYAASFNSTQIEKFTPGGVRSVFANLAVGSGVGLAFDSTGNLYVANGSNQIEKFTPGGVRSVFASTGLNGPYGLAFDSAGNLYVANSGNNTIEKFSSTGTDLGVFASGLSIPTWIAIQSDAPPLPPVLTNIAVTPINPTIVISSNQPFTATGRFSDGSSRVLTSGDDTWTTMAPMPTARSLLAADVINGILYAVGGYNGNARTTVEAYDPATNTWTTKAAMPTARSQLSVGVINGILYAAGGCANICPAGLATVEAYDPVTNTWTTKAPMPTGRFDSGVGVINGILYVVGGGTYDNTGAGTALATVEAYDPVTNTWTTKAPMPTARYLLAAGVVNGILYAVGGANISFNVFYATVEAYDPATNTWTTKAPMPMARSLLAVGVINGILYAVGGYNGNTLATVEAYDPATNTWTTKAAMPTARNGAADGVITGILYAVGGQDSSGTALATVEAYTPANVIWSSSNTSVGTIDQTGSATGLSPGTTTITATSGSISGSTTLTVVNPNHTPLANAGSDQTVEATSSSGASVTLNGSASSDPDGDSLTYNWTGPFGAVSGVSPTVTMPLGTNTVTLTVSDGQATSSDTVQITVHDTTPPVLTVPADIVMDATSPSGAVVSYLVTVTDLVTPSPTVNCAPSSGSDFPLGTTTVSCTATDAALNNTSGSFTVTVRTAAQMISNLSQLVDQITVTNNAQGIVNSLDAKLQAAQDALAAAKANNITTACNQLSSFINSVNAQSGKAITVDQANALINSANGIRAALGCT